MPSDPAVLRGVSSAHRVTATNRQPLRTPESPDNEIIYVSEGVLGLYIMDPREQRQFVGLRFPGELIVPGARGRAGVWPLTRAEVVIASDVGLGQQSALAEQRRRDTLIAQEWLSQSRAPALERLAHLLCEIATRGGYGTKKMPNLFTQVQLADMTGQTSVNVNRVFAELEGKELIEREDGEIIFRDWEELCSIAAFNHDYLEHELEAAA